MSSKAQRMVIIGPETVPGDAATPTVALRATASLEAKVDKIVPDEDVGSFAPTRHYIASLMAEGKLEMADAYYEHLPYLLSMALGAGSKSGSTDPWTYTYTLPGGTAPTFKTYRLEYGDGVNHIVSANDVFATGLEIKGEAGKGISIIADVVGGSTTYPAALGATLTPLATPTSVRMADLVMKMDDLFANIGTTTMPMLISFSWKLENLMHQKQFAGSLYPSGRGLDVWKITLEIIAEMDQAKIESEKDKLLTTSLTAIRLVATGNTNDTLTIDGMYALHKVATLDDRDGNNTVKMTYMAQKDTAGANYPSVAVATNLAAY
jgi:hypothetical protein